MMILLKEKEHEEKLAQQKAKDASLRSIRMRLDLKTAMDKQSIRNSLKKADYMSRQLPLLM
jgi:hypothetical protein